MTSTLWKGKHWHQLENKIVTFHWRLRIREDSYCPQVTLSDKSLYNGRTRRYNDSVDHIVAKTSLYVIMTFPLKYSFCVVEIHVCPVKLKLCCIWSLDFNDDFFIHRITSRRDTILKLVSTYVTWVIHCRCFGNTNFIRQRGNLLSFSFASSSSHVSQTKQWLWKLTTTI